MSLSSLRRSAAVIYVMHKLCHLLVPTSQCRPMFLNFFDSKAIQRPHFIFPPVTLVFTILLEETDSVTMYLIKKIILVDFMYVYFLIILI